MGACVRLQVREKKCLLERMRTPHYFDSLTCWYYSAVHVGGMESQPVGVTLMLTMQ